MAFLAPPGSRRSSPGGQDHAKLTQIESNKGIPASIPGPRWFWKRSCKSCWANLVHERLQRSFGQSWSCLRRARGLHFWLGGSSRRGVRLTGRRGIEGDRIGPEGSKQFPGIPESHSLGYPAIHLHLPGFTGFSGRKQPSGERFRKICLGGIVFSGAGHVVS